MLTEQSFLVVTLIKKSNKKTKQKTTTPPCDPKSGNTQLAYIYYDIGARSQLTVLSYANNTYLLCFSRAPKSQLTE